jgi:hypothetical protein
VNPKNVYRRGRGGAQRELNERQGHPHFRFLFFASALLRVGVHPPWRAVNLALFGCRPSAARQRGEINAAGTTIFLVEQNAHMALAIANRGYVLQSGEVLLTDTAKNLLNHPDVKKAYLGG